MRFDAPSARPSLTASVVNSSEKIVSQRQSQRSAISDKIPDDTKTSTDTTCLSERPSVVPIVLSNDETCERTDSLIRAQPIEINTARRLIDQQQATATSKAARASLSLVSVGSCVCRICHTSAGRER